MFQMFCFRRINKYSLINMEFHIDGINSRINFEINSRINSKINSKNGNSEIRKFHYSNLWNPYSYILVSYSLAWFQSRFIIVSCCNILTNLNKYKFKLLTKPPHLNLHLSQAINPLALHYIKYK